MIVKNFTFKTKDTNKNVNIKLHSQLKPLSTRCLDGSLKTNKYKDKKK